MVLSIKTRTKTSFRYAKDNDIEREKEGEREKESYKERYREGGRDKREREVKGAQSKPNPSHNAFPKL